MIRLTDVTLSLGTRDLLEQASLHVHPGERAGIVGPNGAGKTTLLRLILGELQPEAGTVGRRGGAVFGYLPQKAVSGSERTVWDEVQTRMERMSALRAALATAQADVEAGRPGAVERLGTATDAFRLAGGYALDEKVGGVLHGLGFTPEDWSRSCASFSGGWQMRIALARLLLADPDVLLLDEPTNHLDLPARSWLASYLATCGRTLVVVSHDRWLLDRVCDRTIEVHHRRLTSFRGNLTAWLAEREARAATQEAAFEKQQDEIAKLERFVERFGAKATKAAQAQSKQKALDRMDRIEAPEREDGRPRLTLSEAPGCSQEVLEIQRGAFGWEGGPEVLRDVDLLLLRGQRVAVLGPNGSGKSTLLGALTGELPLRQGRRRVGKDVRVGVFRQDLAQALPADRSALEVVAAAAPLVPPQRIRAALGALGLRGDAALRTVGQLSGGEKARVVLAGFAVQSYNVLLLDEPSNHLDAVTVEVLADALARWEGAVVMVTHDRFLVERVADRVWRIEGDKVVAYEGVSPALLEPVPVARAATAAAAGAGAEEHEERKRRLRERARLEKRIEALFTESEQVEGRIAALDQALMDAAQDPPTWASRGAALGKERSEREARLEAILDELSAAEAALLASRSSG
jgi:ATP-binding cassette subfamily F protein 3